MVIFIILNFNAFAFYLTIVFNIDCNNHYLNADTLGPDSMQYIME